MTSRLETLRMLADVNVADGDFDLIVHEDGSVHVSFTEPYDDDAETHVMEIDRDRAVRIARAILKVAWG